MLARTLLLNVENDRAGDRSSSTVSGRGDESDHQLGPARADGPAEELLLEAAAVFDLVADQEAVVGSGVHGLDLGADAPLPVTLSGSGGGGRGEADRLGLVGPGDTALRPVGVHPEGLEGPPRRHR